MTEIPGEIPKKDYFRVSNDWWDALTRCHMPGNVRQCLDYIIRMTYGWRRKEAEIPIMDFVSATGLKKPHISRALKSLKLSEMVIVTKNGNNLDKRLLTYSFNKYFEQWKPIVTNYGNKKVVTKNGNNKLPETVTNLTKNGNNIPIIRNNTLNNSLNNNSRKSPTFDPQSIPYLLSETLLKQITINQPDFKPANNGIREKTLQRWSKDIDKMIRIDKRNVCAVWNMIIWCQHDDFWFPNIQSATKLRKQYDQLAAQINRSYRDKKTQHDKLLEVGEKWLRKQETQDS